MADTELVSLCVNLTLGFQGHWASLLSQQSPLFSLLLAISTALNADFLQILLQQDLTGRDQLHSVSLA